MIDLSFPLIRLFVYLYLFLLILSAVCAFCIFSCNLVYSLRSFGDEHDSTDKHFEMPHVNVRSALYQPHRLIRRSNLIGYSPKRREAENRTKP